MGMGLSSAGSLNGTGVEGKEEVIPVGFDEGVLRALCDMDVSLRTPVHGLGLTLII